MLSRRSKSYGQLKQVISSHTWKETSTGPATSHQDQPSKSKLRTLRLFSMLSKMYSLECKLTKILLNKISKKLTRPASSSMMLWLLYSIMMALLVPSNNTWLWTINGGFTRDRKHLPDPTRNGSQIRWAKRLVFLSRTVPLTYSRVLEVKMTPFSTVPLMITKIRLNSW